MYKQLFIYFLFFNIQFVLDIYYKSYQLKFLESMETTINMNYFLGVQNPRTKRLPTGLTTGALLLYFVDVQNP